MNRSSVAVIDLGSNSIRLVVYDELKRSPTPLINEKILCGLARNLDQTGELNVNGKEQARLAIARFMAIVKAMEVTKIFPFATSAVRDAKDGPSFVAEMEAQHGIKIRVLTGEEEARYTAMGVISSFHEVDGVVGDLGGGSLELAHIVLKSNGKREGRIAEGASYPIGALRLLSKGGSKEAKFVTDIDKVIKQYSGLNYMKSKDFYAVGGGFRALAKIHLKKQKHPINVLHCYEVPGEEMLKTTEWITKLAPEKIAALAGSNKERAEILNVTAIIFSRILALGQPKSVIFSVQGVREGLLFDLLSKSTQSEDPLIAACVDIMGHMCPIPDKSWVQFGYELNEWMTPIFQKEPPSITRHRLAACILSHLAWYEHTEYRAEIAFRWVLDSKLPALKHDERVYIATALFHRYCSSTCREVTGSAQRLLTKEMVYRARVIGLAMRLGFRLADGVPGVLKKTKIQAVNKKLTLFCHTRDAMLLSKEVLRRHTSLAEVMGMKPEIVMMDMESRKASRK